MASSIEQEIRDLQALHGSPRDPQGRSFVPLADAYRRSGDAARGLEVVGQGVARHPGLAAGHLVAAWCLLDLGDAHGAEAAFRRVLELDEGNARAMVGLGAVLDARGDADGAALVARGRALDPSLSAPTVVAEAIALAVEEAPEDVVAEAAAPSPHEPQEGAEEGIVPSVEALAPSPVVEVGEIDDWDFVTMDAVDVGGDAPDDDARPVAAADVIELVESFHGSDGGDDGDDGDEGDGGEGPEADGEVMELAALAPDPEPGLEEFSFDDLEGAGEFAEAAEADGAAAFEIAADIAALPDHPWTGQDGDLDIEWEVESFYSGLAEGAEVTASAGTREDSPEPAPATEVERWEPEAASDEAPPEPESAPEEERREPEPVAEMGLPGDGPPMDLAELAPDAEPVPWDEVETGPEEDEPEDEPVLATRTLGELYARQGLLPEAVKVFEDLVSRHPDDEDLARRLGELRGALAGGSRAAETAPEPAPAEDDGPTVAEFMAGLLGWERSGPEPG